LLGGIDVMVIAIGVFAISESARQHRRPARMRRFLPVPKESEIFCQYRGAQACRFAFLNGSVTGFLLGCLPGAGATIASFISYGIEKAVSKHRRRFGQGAPEGVLRPRAPTTPTPAARWCRCSAGIPGWQLDRDHALGLVLWA